MSGCRTQMAKAAKFAIPMALAVAVLNALISREGLTVVARLGEVPVLGRLDITLEALVWGLVLGIRVVIVLAVAVLFGSAVDQDALMSIVRRRAGRFGLTAVVASRLMPLLISDGQRIAEANKSLPKGGAVSKVDLVGAIAAGALDRAADAAAALELRGLGDSPCLAVPMKRPWSRHDIAIGLSALAGMTLGVAALLLGWFDFTARDELAGAWGASLFVAVVATAVLLLIPFAERRGVASR